MSKDEVNGQPTPEIARRKNAWDRDTPYEDAKCLIEIPIQPEDYDGPPRYCTQPVKNPNNGRCHYHGGAEGVGSCPKPENLEKLANMKHGLTATREHFYECIEDGSTNYEAQADWMKDMYEWITSEWPAAYNINLDEDPQAEYEFHALAVEIVRAEHAEGYILKEGEKGTKEVVNPDGSTTEQDVPHYLNEMMQRQRKLIMKMEDNLGISRKARLKREDASDATDAIKGLAEVGKELLNPESHDYDSEEFA